MGIKLRYRGSRWYRICSIETTAVHVWRSYSLHSSLYCIKLSWSVFHCTGQSDCIFSRTAIQQDRAHLWSDDDLSAISRHRDCQFLLTRLNPGVSWDCSPTEYSYFYHNPGYYATSFHVEPTWMSFHNGFDFLLAASISAICTSSTYIPKFKLSFKSSTFESTEGVLTFCSIL